MSGIITKLLNVNKTLMVAGKSLSFGQTKRMYFFVSNFLDRIVLFPFRFENLFVIRGTTKFFGVIEYLLLFVTQ